MKLKNILETAMTQEATITEENKQFSMEEIVDALMMGEIGLSTGAMDAFGKLIKSAINQIKEELRSATRYGASQEEIAKRNDQLKLLQQVLATYDDLTEKYSKPGY